MIRPIMNDARLERLLGSIIECDVCWIEKVFTSYWKVEETEKEEDNIFGLFYTCPKCRDRARRQDGR